MNPQPSQQPQQLQIKVRTLTPFDAEDLREIRLESLRYYGPIFKEFHDQEAAQPIEYWEQQCTETRDLCFFGAFVDDALVGVLAGRKWEKAGDNSTILWFGKYTKPDYREMGIANDLYQKRLEWSADRGYRRAVAFVLDGLTLAQSLLEKEGAVKTHTEEMSFAGGPKALWHWYETTIAPSFASTLQIKRVAQVVTPFVA